jgi:uncharacterized protein YjeT (DUF2065 family)
MNSAHLQPITRLVLAVSAVVQLVMGVVAFFAPALARSLLSTQQFAPDLALQYIGALYLGNCLAAIYAYRQDNWVAARTYLASAGSFVAIALLLTLAFALTTARGVAPITWIYVLLSIAYLPLLAWVWRQESGRGATAQPGLAA